MAKKRVYFVRHGEAEGNKQGFAQTANTPLTQIGYQQAQKVAERFTHLPVDIVFASVMDRAQQTASCIAQVKGLDVVSTEFFHEFTRPTSVQGAAHTSEVYQAYMMSERKHYTDPQWRFEDGENFADVLQRVSDGISMLEARGEEHMVVVSHGRLLRFIASFLLHQKQLTADIELRTSQSMRMTNTGITLFEYDTQWTLVTWNDHAHFAE